MFFPTKKKKKGKLIWFHGASVGEILSIIPLIKNYEKKNQLIKYLITSSTLSSSKILKNLNLKKQFINFIQLIIFFLQINF